MPRRDSDPLWRSPLIEPSIEAGMVEMLSRDNSRMREAGCNLAEAATRVVRDYDGLHRLSIAIAGWFSAIANEGDRDQRHASGMEARQGGNEVPSPSDDSPTRKGDAQ